MSDTGRIKVMVVNDSAYMRERLSDLITESGLEVSDTAGDGAEAIRKLHHDRPDVVLLDLEMPNMDGLTFIEQVNMNDKVPIVVVSSYGDGNAGMLLDSLQCGAVDFVPIHNEDQENINNLKNSLIAKLRIAARTNVAQLHARKIANVPVEKRTENGEAASNVVVIGASTGGPRVLCDLLPEIPADIAAGLLIVQHMPAGTFTSSLAKRLNSISKVGVREAGDGDVIAEGAALVAPGDYHMSVNPSRNVRLNRSSKRFGVRPSVNVSMITASAVYGANTIGVLLSGMGHDGAFGMKIIKKRGGKTIAQDETSSIVFGMARAAVELQAVDKLVSAREIPQEIVRAVEDHV
jgi:two-component system chemotaxis response regulator CheB